MMRCRNVGKLFAALLIVLCLPLAGCSSPAASAGPRKAASSQSVTPKKKAEKPKNSASAKTKTPAPAEQDKPKTSDEILAEVNSLSPAAPNSVWDTSTGYVNVPHSDIKSLYVGCAPQSAVDGHTWQVAADGSWLRASATNTQAGDYAGQTDQKGIPSYLLTQCLANFTGMTDAAIKQVLANDVDGQWHIVSWEDRELLYTGTSSSYDFVLK